MLLAARLADEGTRTEVARDCCVFARAALRHRYALELSDDEGLWMIHRDDAGRVPTERTWGPPEAAHRAGVGAAPVKVRDRLPTRTWTLCQGWSAPPNDAGAFGHTFLVRRLDDAGRCVVVESSRSSGPRVRLALWREVVTQYDLGVMGSSLRL